MQQPCLDPVSVKQQCNCKPVLIAISGYEDISSSCTRTQSLANYYHRADANFLEPQQVNGQIALAASAAAAAEACADAHCCSPTLLSAQDVAINFRRDLPDAANTHGASTLFHAANDAACADSDNDYGDYADGDCQLWKLRDEVVSLKLTNEPLRQNRWPHSADADLRIQAPIDTNCAAGKAECRNVTKKCALLDDIKLSSNAVSSPDAQSRADGACNKMAATVALHAAAAAAFTGDCVQQRLPNVPRCDAPDESFSDSEVNNRTVSYESDATVSSSGKYSANDAGVQLSTTSSSVNSNALQHLDGLQKTPLTQQRAALSPDSSTSTSTNTDSFSCSPDADCAWRTAQPANSALVSAKTNCDAADALADVDADADTQQQTQTQMQTQTQTHSQMQMQMQMHSDCANGENVDSSNCTATSDAGRPAVSVSVSVSVTDSVRGETGVDELPPGTAATLPLPPAGSQARPPMSTIVNQPGVSSGAKAAYANMNAANIHESLLEAIQNEILACRKTLIEAKKLRMWTVNSSSVPTEDEGGITIAASAAAAYAAATAAAVVSSVRRKKLTSCESAPPTVPVDSAHSGAPTSANETPRRLPVAAALSSASQLEKRSSANLSASPCRTLLPQSTNDLSTTNRSSTTNNKDALSGVGDAVSIGMLRSSYWSFTKRSLRRSLLNIDDAKFETLAVQMFDAILQYCGVKANVGGSASTLQTRSTKDADRYELVQLLIQHCLANESICNEFYLQLIKETTDNPEHGGAVSINNWHLLAVICGIIPPTDPLIRKYLDAHLRRMCIVKAYPDESKASQKALKYLTLALSKPPRKCPPSCKEIIAVVSRKSVCENVYLLDGRKVAIELVPHVTAAQVCAQVKTQISMQQSARGFALFETCHNYERAVHADTYLCDSLFIWEQNAKRRRTIRDVRYLFKKKLLIEPIMNVEDPTECDLVYNQLINDVFDCRIPVSTETLISLCAMIAQAEYGDARTVNSQDEMNTGERNNAKSDNACDYLSTMRIVPRDMREHVSIDAIEARHRTLVGVSALEAKLKSIELLKEWPLFGSKLFIVMQENSILTRTFYLAVNKTGIHFLQTASSNTLTPAQTPFASYNFGQILSCIPEPESLTLTVHGQYNPIEKNSFRTCYAYQIADLVGDYMSELKGIVQRTRTIRNSSKERTSRASCDRNKGRTKSSDISVTT